MFRLRIEATFDGAHRLNDYKGKCSRLHGHTWKVEVFVKGEKLDKHGLLLDFKILHEKLGEIINSLDHKFLNEIEGLENPTCENISRYFFEKLKKFVDPLKLEKVRVWEGNKSWCEYYEEENCCCSFKRRFG